MQINNTSPNFGSIKLSANSGSKSINHLAKSIGNEFEIVGINNKNIPTVRNLIKSGQVAISHTSQDGLRIIGKNSEDESYLLMKLQSKFDPKAELIDDAPKSDKPIGDAIDLFI